MDKHITVADGLSVGPEDILRCVAHHAVPGERVRLNPKVRFISDEPGAQDARKAMFGERELTVAELVVDADRHVLYRFEGWAGLHNAGAFEDPAGLEQDYGVLIQRDGATWFVPLGEIDAAAPSKEARRVAPVMNRGAHYNFMIPDRMLAAYGHAPEVARTVAGFLAEHEAAPTAGEYALAPLADGAWRLVASPWMCPASEREVQTAEEAIGYASAPRPR